MTNPYLDHQVIDKLPASELPRITAEVQAVIALRESSIKYGESRLNRLAGAGAGLVATAFAMVQLAFRAPRGVDWALSIGAAGLVLTALWSWQIFLASQNPPYPFVQKSNRPTQTGLPTARWKWFYWDALPEASEFGVMDRLGRLDERQADVEREQVDRQWPGFEAQLIDGLSDPRESLREDVRQLYTLHLNERFKNNYLSTMRSAVTIGLKASLVFAVVFGGIAAVKKSGDNCEVAPDNGSTDVSRWCLRSNQNGAATVELFVDELVDGRTEAVPVGPDARAISSVMGSVENDNGRGSRLWVTVSSEELDQIEQWELRSE